MKSEWTPPLIDNRPEEVKEKELKKMREAYKEWDKKKELKEEVDFLKGFKL